MNSTICAISTAHGVGGISIVRLSGPLSLKIAQKLTKKTSFKPRYATLSNLYTDGDEIIDESIIIYFKAPHSFTCEDVIEFQCHGGMISSSQIIDACLKEGAFLATAGEFTKRAVLNGRIDLTRAEAAAKLIESKSIDAAKILSRQLTGELQEFVNTLRDELIEILAFVEVNIDYAEEDLPTDLQEQIKQRLIKIQDLLQNTYEGSKSREGLIDGFKVAIIGKPNVGKSSLLNALLRYDRAIISEIAGTTRDTIEESLKIGTHLVKFVDTAGIREAGDSIEKIGIERSISAIESSDIVIGLFDGSQAKDSDDNNIIELLSTFKDSKEIIAAVNKNDLESKFEIQSLETFEPVSFSCKNDIKAIMNKLEIFLDQKSSADDLILISKRQIDAVEQALNHIDDSFTFLEDGELELFAYNMNEAIHYVASITTLFERDEILDKMFGSFCLGK
ncbi:MAG TPA: tRNA uridine-5-carboxymethylaminomethyl(34) synthesis GTPase MnmE [Campylobacterales bacterium]|nr:tRNA uridine-5-carboxymethylaminomethyl(34) synthesis GTPase MnmE [Campylobacterales bacterium]HIP59065.1 tRNA uridine-5-carboxymethylaminomethyl(34) synthesis GTPase MnmE [Campylobacterales bacterium]